MTTLTGSYFIDPRILAKVDEKISLHFNGFDAAVAVDDQFDFGCREGSLYVPGAEETRGESLRFIQKFPVARRFTTGCDHPANDCSFVGFGGQWPPHCVHGTKGAELVPGLRELPVAKHINKGITGKIESYGAVQDAAGNSNGLDELLLVGDILRVFTRVFVFRLAFDFCVGETAIQLADKGYEVYVVVDLTCAIGIDMDGHNSIDIMINRLVNAGVGFIFSSQFE